jgi:hypothetical protein
MNTQGMSLGNCATAAFTSANAAFRSFAHVCDELPRKVSSRSLGL